MFVVAITTSVGLARSPYCPPGARVEDRDGDGLGDYACVGDWNLDGRCEMEADIQAAIDRLNDPGDKLVELSDCSYAAPAVARGRRGIVELPSNLTVAGRGDATLLQGNASPEQAALANADPARGNSAITIRDLTIDGGWTGGHADRGGFGAGVLLDGCEDCRVESVTVMDTLHACLYAKNSRRLEFTDNVLLRCGNHAGTGARYPCVYLYADYENVLANVDVVGNTCDGSGSAGVTSRRQAPASVLEDILFQGNEIENTALDAEGRRAPCIKIRAAKRVSYVDNTCVNTGGVVTANSTAYRSEGVDVLAAADVTIDGLEIVDTALRSGFHLSSHLENLTAKNVTVRGVSGASCMLVDNPMRNVVVEDLHLEGCGEHGIFEIGPEGSGRWPEEGLTFRRVEVVDVGAAGFAGDGLRFRNLTAGLRLEEFDVRGVSGHGLIFEGGLRRSSLVETTVTDAGGAGIRLAGDVDDVDILDAELRGTGADGIVFPGTVAGPAAISGLRVVSSRLGQIGGRGIAFASGTEAYAVLIKSNTIDGSGDAAIEMPLAWGTRSDRVGVTENSIRDFGRAGASPDTSARGVAVSGNVGGTPVTWNVVEDVNDQALSGVHLDVAGEGQSYVCTNSCVGTLSPRECLDVVGAPRYGWDRDDDGHVDGCDNCLRVANPGQHNNDRDALGDSCDEDDDDDGVPDKGDGSGTSGDNCPYDANPDQRDRDDDGVGDACDVCPDVADPGQGDSDADRFGDACDNCVRDANESQADSDGDSRGDRCDLDDGLIYVHFPGPDRVEWQEEAGYGGWNSYRGDLEVLRETGEYTQEPGSNDLARRDCGLENPWADDGPPDPRAGSVAFYLATGVSAGAESGLGEDGSARERPNHHPCP